MKKVLTVLMTMVFSVGAWAVEDVALDLSQITSGWSGGYDSENSQITFGGWDSKGWEFFPSVSTSEYSGVTVTLSETTTIPLEVKYESGNTQSVTLSGTTETVTFNEVGLVVSIKFANGGDGGTVKLTGATLKGIPAATAASPTSNLLLPFDKMKNPGWGVTNNNEEKTATISQYSWAGWNFYLPVSTDSYKGIQFTLKQIPAQGGTMTIVYVGGAEQSVSLTSTNVAVDFEQSGMVSQIKFNGDGWHADASENLGDLTYGIGDCYLVRKITATIGTAKYATFSTNVAVDFSKTTGITAYIAKKSGDKVALTEVTKVEAGKAVILYADVNATTSYTLETTDEATDDVSANELKVSDGTIAGDLSTIYVLANGAHGVGFYLLKSGERLAAGKAYLEIVGGVAAREFMGFGNGDETTAISTMNRNPLTNNQYFDLQGRHVSQAAKGLYIVNGKKVIIK